ncbi:uncharacterized protein LOC115700952 [Cannabis sativa]|uniref:uncharacterized protein LOC115700952 n=1 Tax=Cannabis sativa TaxID=3483 RepID=UPI0029CA8719|nr:uncharacterized protein LOC115700952 [Cannabis sativa]
MGSLMSGWDSPIFASKSGNNNYKRNKSLTKEEIEAYWRSKQKTVEEHLQHITSLSDTKQDQEISRIDDEEMNYCGERYERSRSLALEDRKESADETSIENLIKKNGWWTKSNWAFLNETPACEAASNTYVSQSHIAATLSSPSKSKSHESPHGITTN